MDKQTMLILIILSIFISASCLCALFFLIKKSNQQLQENVLQTRLKESEELFRKISQDSREFMLEKMNEQRLQQEKSFYEFRHRFDERQMDSFKMLMDALKDNMHEISGKVEERLSEGFKKTTETFTDVVKRLALIDEAQKKITELSSNVVSLQEILSDKRSRGAFGEVQLSALIRNVMPETAFAFQHTLLTGNRADCMLFLPEPTGNVVIDSKFPLENFQQMVDFKISEIERKIYEQKFKQDIKKHINDIASKYIIPGETTDGAMMFIPAEAIFAEIHAHYPDLVEEAQRMKVWLVSPTTMMAVLTTARAVLKDAATRQHVHVIQEHLRALGEDFIRFQDRMDKLAVHIRQAQDDVEQVNTSAKKISSRFNKIEKVDLLTSS
jgi:DNA recombination protein RmuC